EIAARYRQGQQARAPKLRREMVALGLVERTEFPMVLRMRLDHRREGELRRGETAEGVVLVNLAELGAERGRRNAVADLPTGAVVGFAKARHHEAARRQLGI